MENEKDIKTREEQIAEMAKEMRNYGYKHLCAGRVFYYGFCEHLYDAGYRKQSDTVREFAGKLLEKIQPFCFSLIGREIKMEIMEAVGKFGAEVEE